MIDPKMLAVEIVTKSDSLITSLVLLGDDDARFDPTAGGEFGEVVSELYGALRKVSQKAQQFHASIEHLPAGTR